MSKLTTVVLSLFFVLQLTATNAKGATSASVTSATSDSPWTIINGPKCQANDPKTYDAKACDFAYKNAASDTDECATADKDYAKAKENFASACGNAGASTDKGEKNGSIECSQAVIKCTVCGMKGSSSNSSGVTCPERSSTRSTSSDSGAARLAQGEKLGGKNGFCPAQLASVDQDKLQKEYDKVEKEVKDDQKELPKIQQAAQDKQDSTEKDLQGIRDEADKEAADYQKQIKELKRNRDQTQNQIMDQILKINNQISAVNDKLSANRLKRVENLIAFNQSKNKIELNCTAKASNQVEQEQNIVYGMIKSGSYNQGGQQALFNRVGLSNRQAWQRKAQVYKKYCMNSEETVKSQDEANQVRDLGKQQADATDKSIKQEIADLKTQQATLMSASGCTGAQPTMQANGQTTGETQMCQAYRQAQEDLAGIETDHQTKMKSNSDKYNQAVAKGQRDYAAKQQEYAQKQQEVADEKTRFENLKKYMDLVDQAGGSGDPAAYKELQKAFGVFKTAATTVVRCNKKKADESKTAAPNLACSGNCNEAKLFLGSINENEEGSPIVDLAPQPSLKQVPDTTPVRTPSGDTPPTDAPSDSHAGAAKENAG